MKFKGIHFSKMNGKGSGIQAALGRDEKVLVISGETSILGNNFCSGYERFEILGEIFTP